MTDELVAFLRARLYDDEQAATDDGRLLVDSWTALERSPNQVTWDVMGTGGQVTAALGWQALHIARHNPARVLAEVEAKRRIIDLHERSDCQGHNGPWVPHGEACTYGCTECIQDGFPCPTLRLLAMPYGDHPDYREEWRPKDL